jgi:hypothetical protein
MILRVGGTLSNRVGSGAVVQERYRRERYTVRGVVAKDVVEGDRGMRGIDEGRSGSVDKDVIEFRGIIGGGTGHEPGNRRRGKE